jgi:hypothetical protein
VGTCGNPSENEFIAIFGKLSPEKPGRSAAGY